MQQHCHSAMSLSIVLVNCSAWIAGRLLPDWKALTNNYHLVAEKVTGNGD